MNYFAAVFIALAIPAVLCYDEKYDKLDVDKILSDDAIFDAYLNCMLDKGPCDVEHSKEFREILPEVISLACEKCTPIQKKNVRKTVHALQERKPKEFVEFTKKYDPKNEYQEKFAAFLVNSD